MEQSFIEFTEKQVINYCDGKILGNIVDLKVDTCTGAILAIVLPGESGFFGFKKCTDIIIPWEKICKIGKDTIIVDIGMLPVSDKSRIEKKKCFFK